MVAVTASIRQIVHDIIGADADPQQPLMDAGLDSLGTLQLTCCCNGGIRPHLSSKTQRETSWWNLWIC